MRAMDARLLFLELTKLYFPKARVIFANQSRSVKPKLGLVVLTPGPVRRPNMPNNTVVDSTTVSCYLSCLSITVDLFTHGLPYTESGITVYENSAVDDMLAFADFLSSQYVIEWCHEHDVSLAIEGDVQDLTGLVNDTTYEYRSRITVQFYFTQQAIGAAGVYSERSIRYPIYLADPITGELVRDAEGKPVHEVDPETGEPIYTEGPAIYPEQIEGAIFVPVVQPSSTGGINEDIVSETESEIKEVVIEEEYV